MNNMPKIKLLTGGDNGKTNMISEILKKRSIDKSLSMPATVNSFILQKMITPTIIKEFDNYQILKSCSLNNKTINNIKTDELIKTVDSISSTSTDISDDSSNSPIVQPFNITNLLIDKIITTQIDTDKKKVESDLNDNSELITDTNLVIKLKNETHNIEDPKQNIYNSTSDDLIILANLSFLSKIEPNQKIFVSYNDSDKINFELKIDNSYVPKLTRWYYSQGRNETIKILKKLIDLSIEQFDMHIKSNNTIEMSNYNNLLQKSMLGLNNLKITYNSDKIVLEELNMIIAKIKEIIN